MIYITPYIKSTLLLLICFTLTPVTAQAEMVLSEQRLGLMVHDVEDSDEKGTDFNAEWLWLIKRPQPSAFIPRVALGFNLNSAGNTNQLYGGWAWQFNLSERFFTEIMLGGTIHDGETDNSEDPTKREFGCRVLFRETLSFGWQFNDAHSLMLMASHISNGGLCDENSGLTNGGLRYGYRF